MMRKTRPARVRLAAACLLWTIGVALALQIFTNQTLTAAPTSVAPQVASPEAFAGRDFCGRIAIVFVGAGERSNFGEPPNKDDTYNDDRYESDSYSSYLQFRRHGIAGLPSQMIVITSDPQLIQKINKTPKGNPETSSHLVGIAPASVDSFDELLADDPQVSLLTRATKNLERTAKCQRLMKEQESSSVLPFLKIEIVTHSENGGESLFETAKSSIPIWRKKTDFGSMAKWKSNRFPDLFSKDLASRLLKRLDGAVIQSFLSLCKASNVGDMLRKDDTCSCYIASSNAKQLDYSGGSIPEVWSHVMDDKGVKLKTAKSGWAGAESIADMPMLAFRKYSALTANEGEGHDPLISVTSSSTNPLYGFVYTSIDARVDRILQAATTSGIPGAAEWREVEYSTEIPASSRETMASSASGGLESGGVQNALRAYERKFEPVITETFSRPTLAKFQHALDKLSNCINQTKPEPKVCEAIVYGIVEKELRAVNSGRLAESDSPLIQSARRIGSTAKHIDVNTLGSRFHSGSITLGELHRGLKEFWEAFVALRSAIKREASQYVGNDGKFELAFDYMQSVAREAYVSAQKDLFPLLRQDVVKLRLAKLRAAVEMLSDNERIGDIDSAKEMSAIVNELNCLTQVPVGPAFDVRYAERLPRQNAN